MVERTRAVASASNIAITNNVTVTYDVAITYVQCFLNLNFASTIWQYMNKSKPWTSVYRKNQKEPTRTKKKQKQPKRTKRKQKEP